MCIINALYLVQINEEIGNRRLIMLVFFLFEEMLENGNKEELKEFLVEIVQLGMDREKDLIVIYVQFRYIKVFI